MSTAKDLLTKANQLYESKRYAEARVEFDTIIGQEPLNRDAWLGKGNTYFQEGDYEKALQVFEETDKTFPNDALVLLSIAGCLIQLDKENEAQVYIQQADTLPVVLELKKFDEFIASEKPDEALGVIETYLSKNPGLNTFKVLDIAQHLYNQASKLINDKPNLAEQLLSKATQLNPHHAESYADWGYVLHRLKRPEESLEKYKLSLTKSPSPDLAERVLYWIGGDTLRSHQDVIDFLVAQPNLIAPFKREKMIGDMAFQLARYEQAEEAYKRAQLLDPTDAFVIKAQADTYLHRKQEKQARQLYRQAIDVARQQVDELRDKPQVPHSDSDSLNAIQTGQTDPIKAVNQTLGRLHYEIGNSILRQDTDLEEVWTHWQETLQLTPGSDNARSIADEFYNLGQWDKAQRAYTAYSWAMPQPFMDADVLINLGLCHYYLFHYAEARSRFTEAARIESEYQYLAHYYLGYTYIDERLFDLAESNFHTAFRLKPDEYFVIESLILCYSALRKKEDALAVSQKAYARYAGVGEDESGKKLRTAEIDYLTGNIYLDFKELDEAMRLYRAALEKDPQHAYARHNLAHVLEKKGRYALARAEWNEAKMNYQNQL
ncbi:tetratricopeptide repeat protein [Spirosoma taeanense]|uniref:Tetratricopeptide repeat protein n=1 Tax=Spirosoma taeanense TaxID=2735870 RepID=A0A6M5Y5I6_9BACT|nr:tetratricopeptide repeat protein [Spirosoma taeanense]QJW89089.1 tetratricopeptide repeat protein [Spirosoma taeanense]